MGSRRLSAERTTAPDLPALFACFRAPQAEGRADPYRWLPAPGVGSTALDVESDARGTEPSLYGDALRTDLAKYGFAAPGFLLDHAGLANRGQACRGCADAGGGRAVSSAQWVYASSSQSSGGSGAALAGRGQATGGSHLGGHVSLHAGCIRIYLQI